MQQIPIQQLPNQSFTVLLDSNQWGVTMKTVGDTTVVGLTRNGVGVLDGARAAPGAFIIPSEYEEAGNFFFVTQNQQLPYYTRFNVTQSLIYIGAAELAALRAPKAPPITGVDFNPLAAFPMRFAPQGYVRA
jgi:hypothetical protein